MPSFETLLFEIKDRIAYITLNRPEKSNALSPQIVSELKEAFSKASSSPLAKIIVLKANGTVFSAGADLAYLQSLQNNTYEENLADSNNLKELFTQMYFLNKVIIAQVEGHAIAGGCGLAGVCDFVFSTPEAKFGYTEVKIGFVPAIVSIFLIPKIGETNAKELLLPGKLISAEYAQKIGLIHYIYEKDQIAESIQQFALNLCKNTSGESLRITKDLIARIQTMDFFEALELAASTNAHARLGTDCKRGIAAFLNKESIEW
ncbi:MAG: enoyl-CoA hydratase/isomerase family protein [Sphingobacteriales bacterium]|nr:enoyl-CoA hydratase/isomerase family protein [Sphingobacteriales bacterium]